MFNLAQLAVAISNAMVGATVHLVARPWSKRRLFFVDLGRELDETDRVRARRVQLVNGLVCGAGVVMALVATSDAIAILSTLLPMLPLGWLIVESVRAARRTAMAVPARFVVPLEEPPGVWSYVSVPLQAAQLALVLLSSAAFIMLSDQLPERMPMQWNARGEVARWGKPGEMWLFLGIMLFDVALMWLIAWSLAKERWALPPQDPERYATLQLRRRTLMVRMMEWMMLGLNAGMAVMWIGMTWSAGRHTEIGPFGARSIQGSGLPIVVGILLTSAAVLGPLAIFMGKLSKVQDELRAIAKTDVLGTRPDGWRAGGLIYYAPDDPAVFIPKRFGMGQTLNFARGASWAFIAAIVATPLVIAWLAIALAR